MIQSYLLQYGYALLFVGVIVEGDGTLLAASFLAHRGYFRFAFVIALTIVSTAMAYQSFFWISRRNGRVLLDRMKGQDPKYARLEEWIRRRGIALLLVSRFLYGLRTAIPAVCGVVGMPPTTFFIANLAGAIIWSALLGFAGYLGGHALSLLLGDIRRHELLVALLLLFGGLGVILWRTHGRDLRGVAEALFAPDKLGIDSASLFVRAQSKAKGVLARLTLDAHPKLPE